MHWLGLRPVIEWAYGKVFFVYQDNSRETSLWEHTRHLASLHKSALAEALITGRWPEPLQIAWRTLAVELGRAGEDALPGIKELVEVEYPLGNELYRDQSSIHFTFPGLEDEPAEELVRELEKEITSVVGVGWVREVSVSPTRRGWQGLGVGASAKPRPG